MIVEAVVEKLTTDDGLVQFERAQVGQRYLVETTSIRRRQSMVHWLEEDAAPLVHEKDIIFTVEGEWLPLETLSLRLPDGTPLRL
jgi:hypothetical protein